MKSNTAQNLCNKKKRDPARDARKPHEKIAQQPSEKSRWAYWMQAIEPTSVEINRAFPGYHAQWLQVGQAVTILPETFKNFRNLLGLTVPQLAAYLRRGRSTVYQYESGESAIPFSDFEVMRLLLENVRFKLSHPAWDGWFVSDKGVLVSPNYGGHEFTPERLDYLEWASKDMGRMRHELEVAKRQVEEARAENTRLRQMFVAQGVVDELAAMQDSIAELMERIATAKVLPFPVYPTQQEELEKTA